MTKSHFSTTFFGNQLTVGGAAGILGADAAPVAGMEFRPVSEVATNPSQRTAEEVVPEVRRKPNHALCSHVPVKNT